LIEAIKRNGFNPGAGQRLDEAARESRSRRRQTLRGIARQRVLARLKRLHPKTLEDWLDFVLEERLLAAQECVADETKLKARLIEAAVTGVRSRQRFNR
jgi:hypothetical protein